MTGFRTAIKNVRLKSDPDGRVNIVRVHKIDASKRKRVHAQASKEQAKWKDKSK